MFKVASKVLVIAVMLVAFIGQTLAFNTSMSCETLVDSSSLGFSELLMHNDSNSIDSDNSKDCCGIECCDVGCTCIANACSLFVYFNTEVESTKIVTLSEHFYKQQSAQPKSISTLLYRPPIFIS
ncbi:MAG: hypothetical protein ACI9N3_002857 [Colwellia sp.]|jgi:hypothetical protein